MNFPPPRRQSRLGVAHWDREVRQGESRGGSGIGEFSAPSAAVPSRGGAARRTDGRDMLGRCRSPVRAHSLVRSAQPVDHHWHKGIQETAGAEHCEALRLTAGSDRAGKARFRLWKCILCMCPEGFSFASGTTHARGPRTGKSLEPEYECGPHYCTGTARHPRYESHRGNNPPSSGTPLPGQGTVVLGGTVVPVEVPPHRKRVFWAR